MDGGFGLYVHWPFCRAKCPYCDFNSHVAAEVDHKRWEAAYLSEIQRLSAETPGRVLQTIFFGGGTPSLMAAETVAAVIAAARAAWPGANDLEVTLEANPTSVEAGRFAAFAAAGVNRLSLGVQALNDADLAALGRQHSAAEAMAAFDLARRFFPRISFDLIYARQNQSLADWRAELGTALTLAADHLSLYQLTIEEGTAFAERLARGGLKGLPEGDLAADFYDLTQDLCEGAGLPAYEVSNHARPGAESRHNLIYWQGGDYLGIGPGAHGRLTLNGQRWATECPRAPGAWLAAVEGAGQNGESPREALSPAEAGAEYLLMGLRLSEGISPARYAQITGAPLAGGPRAELVALGLIAEQEDRLHATPAGRLLLNQVIAALAGD